MDSNANVICRRSGVRWCEGGTCNSSVLPCTGLIIHIIPLIPIPYEGGCDWFAL